MLYRLQLLGYAVGLGAAVVVLAPIACTYAGARFGWWWVKARLS